LAAGAVFATRSGRGSMVCELSTMLLRFVLRGSFHTVFLLVVE